MKYYIAFPAPISSVCQAAKKQLNLTIIPISEDSQIGTLESELDSDKLQDILITMDLSIIDPSQLADYGEDTTTF